MMFWGKKLHLLSEKNISIQKFLYYPDFCKRGNFKILGFK